MTERGISKHRPCAINDPPCSGARRLKSSRSTSTPSAREYFFGHLARRKGFDTFSRAGLITAGRAVDEQNARVRSGIFLPFLRLSDGAAGFEPFNRQKRIQGR